MYINNSLYPCTIQTEKINNVDLIFVELRNHNNKVIVCLIYRPPGQSPKPDNKLFDVITEICGQFETLVMGDFNLPVAQWGGTLRSHSGYELYNTPEPRYTIGMRSWKPNRKANDRKSGRLTTPPPPFFFFFFFNVPARMYR